MDIWRYLLIAFNRSCSSFVPFIRSISFILTLKDFVKILRLEFFPKHIACLLCFIFNVGGRVGVALSLRGSVVHVHVHIDIHVTFVGY